MNNLYIWMFTKEREKEKQRPRLENVYESNTYNKNYLIRCTGVLLVDKYMTVKNKKLYRVVNVVDNNGIYIADHIHLNFKEDEFSYNYDDRTNFIDFIGKIEKYKRKNGTYDYEVDIINKVIFMHDEYVHNHKYNSINPPYDKLKINKFKNMTKTEYYNLIDKLRNRLNELTYNFGNNFVYYYILNVFLLNTATVDLYSSNVVDMGLSEYTLIKLINIIANVIDHLELITRVNILELLRIINYMCNILQGIKTYKNYTNDFRWFCEDEVTLFRNGRSIDQLWNSVLNRKRNFGNNPNPYNISIEYMAENAYTILYDYL